jgi:two-component system cell cycle sensor histidine kinase/response regulator CckA
MQVELSVILDAIPAPVFYKDATGRYIGCNKAFEAYLGKSRDEIVGKDVYGLSPKETADVYKAADDALFASRGTQIYEARVRYADGTHHDVVFHKATFTDASGRLAGLVGTILDITPRKQAEDALKLFRALIDHSNDTFEVLDPATGRILDVNENGCLEHGYSREEYLSLSVFDLAPTVDPSQFGKQTGTSVSKSMTVEGVHRRKDGSTFPVEVSLKRVVLDRDYLVAVVRNVTDRKRVDAEHLQFTLGVTRSSDAICLTTRDGTITYVNPAFEKLYGFSRAEVIGKTPRLLKSGAQDPAFYERFWQTLLANRVVHVEMINRAKDGRLVHVDATANPIVDDRGETIGFLAIQRDITERKYAAEHRERLEDQLRASQKMDAIGSLAGGIAHDFNNLLSVILSFTSLMLEDLKPGDPMREDVEEVKRAGERARDLTRQLLAFGRKQMLEPRPSDLNQILEGMEKMLRRILGEDIGLSLLVPQEVGTIYADPGQLEQIVMNLVVNARDAAPRGGSVSVETKNVELDAAYAADHPGVAPIGDNPKLGPRAETPAQACAWATRRESTTGV